MKTLNNVVKENFIPKEVHFCKIDVEGFEKQVLESIDFNFFRPWIFAIESTIPETTINIYGEWEQILIHADYRFVLQKGINRYYIDNNRVSLFKKIDNLKNIEEKYDIFYVNPFDFHELLTWKVVQFVILPLKFFNGLIRQIKYKLK